MDIGELFLVAVALFPAVFLCCYIFKKDKAEKEPISLLLLLLGLGVAICFPTVSVCTALDEFVNNIFMPYTTEVNGLYYLDGFAYYLHTAIDNFIVVALVEEGFKWLVLVLVIRKNKNFNSLFDGIIYAAFVSLGFAGFENVLYSLNYGMSTALLRMVTAVPGHMFDAVIMGYYFSWYHIKNIAGNNEIKLKSLGIIPDYAEEYSGKKDFVYSLLMPVLAHGFYDFCCNVDSAFATLSFVAFLSFLYIFCFRRIQKMSDEDTMDTSIALSMIARKYPEVREGVIELVELIRLRQIQENIPVHRVTFNELCDYLVYRRQKQMELAFAGNAQQSYADYDDEDGEFSPPDTEMPELSTADADVVEYTPPLAEDAEVGATQAEE